MLDGEHTMNIHIFDEETFSRLVALSRNLMSGSDKERDIGDKLRVLQATTENLK